MVQEKQIESIRAGWVGALNFTFPAAASSVVTSALTAALSTAGKNNLAVPLQNSPNEGTMGVVVSTLKNRCIVLSYSDEAPIADDVSDKEVYGRITETAGVYTLSLFVRVGGVETAYTMPVPTAINFYAPYRFSMESYPTDAALTLPVNVVENDPSGISSGEQTKKERLTVTGTNAISNLGFEPIPTANVFLSVNGVLYSTFGGGNAAFALSGVTSQIITWNPNSPITGFNVNTTDVVEAIYTIEL